MEKICIWNIHVCIKDIQDTFLKSTRVKSSLIGDLRVVKHFWDEFTARQNYFTHFEPSESLGGMKMGDPREKTPDHPPAIRTWLVSHVTRSS